MMMEGDPNSCMRWQQVEPVESVLAPDYVHLIVPQPKAAETYYDTRERINQHNRD
jgi:hypothetical protein